MKFRKFLLAAAAALLIFTAQSGGNHAAAQNRLVLVTPPNTVDTVISEVITREAYNRIGITVKIKKYPGERALRLANAGKVDGEVQRINGIAANYHNLVQVFPAINYIEGAAFSATKEFEVAGWRSLKPYRLGYIRGIKFAERNTKEMDSTAVGDYPGLFQMLNDKRLEVIISPRLNGLYQMKQLGVRKVRELKPAIMRFDLFHYLHQKHVKLVPKISTVFKTMERAGELAAIRKHVIDVLMARAKKKLPICDMDYACFDVKKALKN